MFWPLEKSWMAVRVGKDRARQVSEALLWMSGIVQPDDKILVEFPNYRRIFYFDFPLRYGDAPKIMRRGRPEPTFVVCNPGGAATATAGRLRMLFSAPFLAILENEHKAARVSPIRWGLTQDEKETALRLARQTLDRFLKSGERSSVKDFLNLPQRFYLKTDLDAALWTDGRLRGSWVVENRTLAEGIIEAVIGASRDQRFKPLGPEELPDTRIEITLMSDLRIPLSQNERKRDVIYSEKGYLVQRGAAKGYFLPEVFNIRRFRNLDEFLGDLAQEKAGLTREAARHADVFIFEVDDFIESEDRQSALVLRGPVIRDNFQFSIFNFQIRLKAAADWLCQIQEPDGNISPIIDPLTGRALKQIDWPRLAFTAWSLAEFGKAINEKKYIQTAEKSFEYLRRYLISNPQSLISNHELTLAYFGQLSLSLGKPQEAAVAADKIIGRLNALNFEPITFAQITSFLKIIINNNLIVRAELRTILDNLLQILRENFEKNLKSRQSINLALWAELVNTFWGADPEFSQKVADWLKNQQLPNGAFPDSTISDFVYTPTPNLVWGYTRGTGKIFEVLALDPDKNKEAINKCLTWLISMQYDEENTFFVSAEIRPKILGGFRHDYFNPEAWIDAAGHILLGDSRLLPRTHL